MDTLLSEVKLIRMPYDLRRVYNAHREKFLDNPDRYYALMRQANKLLNQNQYDVLDRTTIENFIFDYECDYEEFNRKKKERIAAEKKRLAELRANFKEDVELVIPQPIPSTIVVEEKPDIQMTKALTKVKDRLPPSKSVKIVILNPECDNLYEEVCNEIFRVALLNCKSKNQLAKRLGISIRTVRNKLNELIGESHELSN